MQSGNRFYALLLVLALAGCAHEDPTVNVACKAVPLNVPVPVKAIPDKSLLTPVTLPAIQWSEPGAPSSSSCVSADGEQQLLDFFDSCVTRQDAWRAWALEPMGRGVEGTHEK